MSTGTTVEAVQQTLAEYERLAIGTGEWNGTDAPEFSNDGQTWTAAWLPSEGYLFPALARATVYRKGVDRPVVAVVRWDEAVPADADWRGLWERKPIALFGAFAKRAALRPAFRDVIGDRREPDEAIDAPAAVSTGRDWLAELADCDTPKAVRALHADAKSARAVTVELEREIRKRLVEVSEPAGGIAKIPAVPLLAKGGLVMPAAPSTPETASMPEPVKHPVVTPADMARALAERPIPAPQQPRQKNGRRPQKQKPRGQRG